MDPNETLRRIRELSARHIYPLSVDESAELQELVDSLDTWLAGGGFLPTAWAR